MALLLVAAEVFPRDEYSSASLNEIVRAAGWAKSSLYRYIGSKMARLLDELGNAARLHPETRGLGLMYHRDDSSPADSELRRFRGQTEGWLAQAVQRGVDLGVLRRDLTVDMLLELTVAVLGVLDRSALERSAHSPGGPEAGRLSLGLVRDLIGAPGASGRGQL